MPTYPHASLRLSPYAKKARRFALFLALSVLCWGNAYAQSAPPDGAPGNMPRKPPTPPLSQYEDQLRDTFTELRITNAQQPLWQAYENKVHAFMTDLSAPQAPLPDTTPALQKLQHESDIANDRLAALEDIVDAAQALYAALDDKQKVIADRRLASTVPPLNSANFLNPGAARAGAPGAAGGGGGKRRRGGGGGGGAPQQQQPPQ